MYGIVNKCFGVDLREAGSRAASLLREIARMDMGDEVDEWDDDGVLEWAEESIPTMSFGWSAYSGSGDGPLAIGFEIQSWPYWELEGDNGIVAAAQINACKTTPYLDRWKQIVNDDLWDLIERHGFVPRVFWTTSTS